MSKMKECHTRIALLDGKVPEEVMDALELIASECIERRPEIIDPVLTVLTAIFDEVLLHGESSPPP